MTQHPLLIALIADQKSQIYDLQTKISALNDQITEINLTLSESGKHIRLSPAFSCSNKDEFFENFKSKTLDKIIVTENRLIDENSGTDFSITRYCLCCNKNTEMTVDYQHSTLVNNRTVPNWRERVICTVCNMNNRQRVSAKISQSYIDDKQFKNVYLMEKVTPIYSWINAKYPELNIHGSEYLGPQYDSGSVIDGIRHEDVMNMSFNDDTIDFIISNDVFEHVPDITKTLKECARVLQPNGIMVATMPFRSLSLKSEIRAKFEGDVLHYLLPAQYHGNPVSEDGSLVFHDFGWDIIGMIREGGFSKVHVDVYASDEFGHFGRGNIIFVAEK